MANLPQELVIEILLRLPVKFLLRFKCVCKAFCAIIESQSFINSHFQRSSSNRIHLIDLEIHKVDKDHFKLHAVDFNDDFQQELMLEKIYDQTVNDLTFSYCNGLVLLHMPPSKFFLWNPSTRYYRTLPSFPVTVSVKNSYYLSFGLGYDSTTDDYKAVVITSEEGLNISQVWIFELRSSCWRRIQDFPYLDYKRFQSGGNGDCFVDGAVHFVHLANDFESYRIVAFDVATETFYVVCEPVHPSRVYPQCLHVFGGCLCITVWSYTKEEQVDVYVRKKDGVAFTWTRLYSVTEKQFSYKVFECFADGRVAFSKEGDKVFVYSKRKVFSYDLKEESLQKIVCKNTHNMDLFSCTESLVSVGSQDEEE